MHDDDLNHLVGKCTRCGMSMPVEEAETQEEADEKATLYCECKAGAEDEAAKYTQGECDFCGQTVAVSPCDDQGWADEAATHACNCAEAKAARQGTESEEERTGKREDTLRDAREDIEDLFGDAAADRGEESLPDNERELLFAAATLVFDQNWRSISVNVTQGLRLKISVTDKGKLTIQRDDSSTRKREHK